MKHTLLLTILETLVVSRIIFLEEYKNQLQKIPEKISCPNQQEWCENPVEYPEFIIRKVMTRQNEALKTLFEQDKIIEQNMNKTHDDLTIRMFETEFENVCHSETNYIRPKAARNKAGEFRFIVNQDEGNEENYIQLVKTVTCTTEGQECGHGMLSSPIETSCHQEYSDHKLVALSDNGEELVVDTFSFPSCCSCLMRNTLEY